jgi:hypothetical protein
MALVLQLGVTTVTATYYSPQQTCYDTQAEKDACAAPYCDACAPVSRIYEDGARTSKASIESITLRYNTGNAATLAIANYETSSNKHGISGTSVNGTATVTCTKPSGFSATVSDGATFTIVPSGATVECTITGGSSGSQSVMIHTSCSAPIGTGDRWGAVTLMEFSGSSATQCPPPCEACCSTHPAVTPVTNNKVVATGSREDCEPAFDYNGCTGGSCYRLKDSAPAKAALHAFVMDGAGTGGSCVTTNPHGNIETQVQWVDSTGAAIPTYDWIEPSSAVVKFLEHEICTRGDNYCPDLSLKFQCRESCEQSPAAQVYDDLGEWEEIGTSSFHLGYESVDECPGPEYGSCDVCWTKPNEKTKPTSLRLRYVKTFAFSVLYFARVPVSTQSYPSTFFSSSASFTTTTTSSSSSLYFLNGAF